MAVIVCVPIGSELVVTVAMPELLRVAVPIEAEPRTKLTVPVATGPEEVVTFAVKVTDCPTFDGFADEVSAVVVTA